MMIVHMVYLVVSMFYGGPPELALYAPLGVVT